MKSARIVILDDNLDYGGHQVMTLYGIQGMLKYGSWELLGLHASANQKNGEQWQAIASENSHFTTANCPTQTRKFQAIRRYFEKDSRKALAAQIEAFQPDLILVIQGNIEQCCTAFLLQDTVNCPIVSYLPLPHTHAEMGAKLGWLRDLTCKRLYREPDGIITISPTLAQMLKDYGTTGHIQVVENGIPLTREAPTPAQKLAARAQLGLSADGFVWAQVGRTEFKQKAQDFSFDLFNERSASHPEEQLILVGGGPDWQELNQRCAEQPKAHCHEWMSDPGPVYMAADAILLPSRYEGVPLAMLEALSCGIPVISTDRDGMRDWLPQEWRFEYRNSKSAHAAMQAVRTPNQATVDHLKKRVWESHSVAAFQQAFNAALEHWI